MGKEEEGETQRERETGVQRVGGIPRERHTHRWGKRRRENHRETGLILVTQVGKWQGGKLEDLDNRHCSLFRSHEGEFWV